MRRFLGVLVLLAALAGAGWWLVTSRELDVDELPFVRRTPLPTAGASPAPSVVRTPAASPTPSGRITPLTDTRGLVAFGDIGMIRLVDAASGERQYELETPSDGPVPLAWSPSGRSLTYLTGGRSGEPVVRAAIFPDGRDILVGPQDAYDAGPVWLDEERLVGARAETVVETRIDGAEGRRMHARDLGMCRDTRCAKVTGIAVDRDGSIAVTSDAGDLAVVDAGFGSTAQTTRSPDETRCIDPWFRPGTNRVGVTCIVVPLDYNAGSDDERRNHYDFNAWVVDLDSKVWTKVRTESGGHEWGASFFPWSPDGSRHVVTTYSEGPCTTHFALHDGTGRRASASVVAGAFGSFAADAKSVVFEAEGECASPGVYVADLTLAKPRRIADAGRAPVWSPAGAPVSSPAASPSA